MSQDEMIATIVREVLAELNGGNGKPAAVSTNGNKLDYRTAYPLSKKRPDLVRTASGKSLDDITLEAIVSGAIKADDIRITKETLEYQAQIAESINRPQLARNMRRAGELTRVPDARVLEIYNALRPNRSTKAQLLAIADELENKYEAKVCANHVREAANVYESRGVLRKE